MDMLNNFPLLFDYARRGRAVEEFDSCLSEVNRSTTEHNAAECNNNFIPTSLGVLVTASWIFCGGLVLVNDPDQMSLGTFLANMAIFDQFGKSWGNIYEKLCKIQEVGSHLSTVAKLMNLPTDSNDQCKFVLECATTARELAEKLDNHHSGFKDLPVDCLPIKFHNYCHAFGDNQVLKNLSLDLAQGKFHGIQGTRGAGKSLLLKLCGARTLMKPSEDGYLFIPMHLNVLHISKEPLFVLGTLYENLTYGVREPGNKDGRIERVKEICRQLGIPRRTMDMISDAEDAKTAVWSEVLPHCSKHLLNIARGLIASPEILVIHKVSAGLGPRTKPIVFKALQKFVTNRGIEQDPRNIFFRRPRTCIISIASEDDARYVDEVHEPLDGDHSLTIE